MSTPSLLILPGDGIGPEVMAEVRKIISWYGEKRDLNFDVSEDLVGGIAYDTHGTPLTDAACCGCAKKWIFFPICDRRNALMLWLIFRR